MKQTIKKITKKIFYLIYARQIKKYNQIDKIIDKYEYISFDIFDTLIKRNVQTPTDIFEIIEKRYGNNLVNFKNKRINAENKARKKSKYEEVTLKEIYDELDYSQKIKEELYKLELQVEKDFCVTNKEILKIYNKCVKANKKIFLTSDMYLPRKTVEEILKKNGYQNYQKIYLSNEKRLTKHTGNLFKCLIKEQNINKSKLVHIGDSLKGDFLSPKKLNIKAGLIPRNVNNCIFTSKKNKTLEYGILSSFINNNIDNSLDYYSKFGYEILGPILYSFTSFIHENIKNNQIDKIYFLARDAKIIMDVYTDRFKNDLPLYYINASRKSMIMSSIEELNDYEDIYTKAKSLFNSTTTVKNMFQVFRMNNVKTPYENKYLNELTEQQKKELFYIIKEPLTTICKKQNQYLKQYLKQNDFNGNIAIVDIGWNGTIQYNLQKYTDKKTNLFGYYYGIHKSKSYPEYQKLNRTGFLFNYDEDFYYQSIINLTISIFETLFLSTEPSTIGYQKKEDKIVPLYAEKDNDEKNIENIIKIQNGAKKLIKDINKSNIKELDNFNKDIYFENYKNFAVKPTLKNVNKFKNLNFTNISNQKLINNKSLLYYLFHLKKFYLDFSESSCKVFFLKSVFKINLPYYKILKKLYVTHLRK